MPRRQRQGFYLTIVADQLIKYCHMLSLDRSITETFTLAFNGNYLVICSVKHIKEGNQWISKVKFSQQIVQEEPPALSVADVLLRVSCVPAGSSHRPEVEDGAAGGAGSDLPTPRPWMQDVEKTIDKQSYILFEPLGKGATCCVSLYEDERGELRIIKARREDREDVKSVVRDAIRNEKSVLSEIHQDVRIGEGPEGGRSTVIQEVEENPEVTIDGQPVRFSPKTMVIPSLDVKLRDEDYLCIKPLCDTLELRALNYEQVVLDLVSALYIGARHGYVHRDVRPANIMARQDDRGRAVLLDWGFAVKWEGQTHEFAGTTSFASQNVLSRASRAPDSVAVTPADDACSLVKTLHFLTDWDQDFFYEQVRGLDYEGVRQFWERRLELGSFSLWRKAYEAATEVTAGSLESYGKLFVCLRNAALVA